MSNQISQIEFDSILTRCVDSLDSNSEWCGYINRALMVLFHQSGGLFLLLFTISLHLKQRVLISKLNIL